MLYFVILHEKVRSEMEHWKSLENENFIKKNILMASEILVLLNLLRILPVGSWFPNIFQKETGQWLQDVLSIFTNSKICQGKNWINTKFGLILLSHIAVVMVMVISKNNFLCFQNCEHSGIWKRFSREPKTFWVATILCKWPVYVSL